MNHLASTCKYFVLIAAIMACGCQRSEPMPATRAVNRSTVTVRSGDAVQSMSPEQAIVADPCAARLHEIAGAILLYYAGHKTMPEALDQLQSSADTGAALNFNCPTSGQPYVYVRGGLSMPGRSKRIVVHDPSPDQNGNRWCIMMAEPAPGAARSAEVVVLPEAMFRGYQAEAK